MQVEIAFLHRLLIFSVCYDVHNQNGSTAMQLRWANTGVTIRDVATHCDVSPMTVSRVINSAPSVHPETRKKVEEAIRTLGYIPATTQRAPMRRSLHTIALVLPDVSSAFFRKIIAGVERAADAIGYRVIICNSSADIAREQRYLTDLLVRRVDGVIIAPVNDSSRAALQTLRAQHTPFVLIDRGIPDFDADLIQTDNVTAATLLTKTLIANGHQRIGYISGDARISSSRDRLYGYRMALDTAGILYDSALVREDEGSCFQHGYVSALELFRLAQTPSALFAANSDTALGVIRACRDSQLLVPDDMIVVCFDDLEHAETIFPFLTVIEQPTARIGQLAVERLHLLCTTGTSEPTLHMLPAELIQRCITPTKR
jgi:DNA-binding LacI/PurR family transcriptional regulator